LNVLYFDHFLLVFRRKLSADDEFSSQLSSPVASQPTSFFQKSAAEIASHPVELSRVNSFASSTSSQDRISEEIEVELSLCGSAFESEALMQQCKPSDLSAAFNAHKISSTQLSTQPNLIYHPGLVVRFGRQLFPGRVALPLLISYLAFGIPLTDEALQSLSVQSSEAPLQAILAIESSDKFTTASSPEKATTSDDGGTTDQTSKHGLFSWFRSDRKNKLKVQTADLKVQSPKSSSRPQSAAHDVEETTASDSSAKVEAALSPSLSASLPPSAFEAPLSPLIAPSSTHLAVPVKEPLPASASSPARTERSRRPSHAVLRSFNLQPGLNTISFTVTSTLQGIQTVEAHIFLWRANAKVVISDVDGTITRSDLLGNIMPLMGRDWSHSGVTALFSAIARNGYEILYLTSRAIGQAGITRSYIHSLRQNDIPLPEGPVIMCPDSLIHAFKREVIDRRPHEFKIAALMGVREVFHEDHQPFYAGIIFV
jgi:phosphatidate phosphatase LPIN